MRAVWRANTILSVLKRRFERHHGCARAREVTVSQVTNLTVEARCPFDRRLTIGPQPRLREPEESVCFKLGHCRQMLSTCQMRGDLFALPSE